MSDRFTRRILDYLADSRYRARKAQELAQELSIPEAELDDFLRSVQQLVEKQQIVIGVGDHVVLPPPGKQMTGVFRLHERGFGFIVPESPTEHGDLFVPPGNAGGAMTGDRVTARVIHQGGRAGEGRSPYVGLITDIIQRAENRYVGNLVKQGSHHVVEVDAKVLQHPVVIRDPHSKGAKIGDKVVIELTRYPSEAAPGEGVITEVLGEQGEPDVETIAVMRAYGLPDHFKPEVLDDARAAAQSFQGDAVPPDREDLTGEMICTIDPPDAKDYDDAISIHRLDRAEEGEPARRGAQPNDGAVWELGVHIADVSSFVRLGTALDAEARKRGNSAYLPRKVIPMLPETLSNGVCSLQEGVNRFCKSAFIRYDARGNVVGQRFANTVIRSAKRLTYLEAQALIDSDIREARRHAKSEPKYPTRLINKIKLMDELAKVIRERRQHDGMIVLGLPEVELIFDDAGRVVDAQPQDTSFTHTLIEMFMVEANEATARLFNSLHVPMIRRVHPDPDAYDITELRQFARVAGYNIPSRPSRKELQALLDGVRGKPAQHAVHLAVLKTLSKAEYSPLLIGHFALASKHYTHFTSPIRRYPDLIVHRGLDAYFEAVKKTHAGKPASRAGGASLFDPPDAAAARRLAELMTSDPRCPSEDDLTKMGRECSGTERKAESAEDSLRTYLILDLLSNKLGEDFDGVVTGVTGSGIFIEISRYLVDGFVRLNDLPGRSDDRWQLNRTTGALVAQRSGRVITIGDRFTIRLARVNPVARQLDLVIIEAVQDTTKKKGPRAPMRRTQQPPTGPRSHQHGPAKGKGGQQRFKKRRKGR
ncbi:MAG: VacB/RNase II family 3'-5' exoribonuclease [Planctomycetes bacterium]|nr:VacB/RNase II family 3'-5' exoribonuclease [Planctomycetota bacterium]